VPSAVTDAYGCGNIELISYHDGRGPGGDGKDKGEDEQKLDHGHASAFAIASGRATAVERAPIRLGCAMMGRNVTIL
jgi:hypothetical protein